METLRSGVIGRWATASGRLALGLLAAASAACAGCSQPRSFLDNSVMLQQFRDAELAWGPDGLVGQAPVAYRAHGVPQRPGRSTAELLAQADGQTKVFDLFPASYHSAPQPRAKGPEADGRMMASTPARTRSVPRRDAVMAANFAPPKPVEAPSAAPRPSTPARGDSRRMTSLPRELLADAEPLPPLPAEAPEAAERRSAAASTYVAGRPRDDGDLMTPLADDSEPLPPLPEPNTSLAPAATPTAPEAAGDDIELLPPLPPGSD